MGRVGRVRSGAICALLWLVAAPAAATPDTLQRSLQNIAFAPLDLALAPVVAARSVAENMRHTDDPTAVRVLFAVPGFAWNATVVSLAAVLREVAGLLELLPGLGLLLSETDSAPLYDPVENSWALVDVETRALHVKFGVDYTTVPFER